MGTTTEPRRRGNLRWALLFAAVVLAQWFVGLPLLEALGRQDDRVDRTFYVLAALAIVSTPFALVWLVAEAHLRFSPRGRVARGVVGWSLALTCLAVLVHLAPVGLYLLVMSLAFAFGDVGP
ncbi:hypothetical protein ACOCJ5_08355 [Knoellia sp. CPCC 206450]|uniref:hypothetical protein n=1 Tax=Knoellia tibetensis TaxID=3404798 RepID=UPI003B42A666